MPLELTAYLSVFNLFSTQWIMAILSKRCKPDSFESHKSLELTFTNIHILCSNFAECKSFLESNPPDILALCETNLHDSIDSGNFSVSGYLPLIRKDSIAHMHSPAVYVKEDLPFERDLSLENSTDSYFCFRLSLLPRCLTSFSLSITFFYFIQHRWGSLDQPICKCDIFREINVHHKD